MDYLEELELLFSAHTNETIAIQQSAYMRNQFSYYGIKSPQRRQLTMTLLSKHRLPPKNQIEHLLHELWIREERDYQLFGLDLACKYKRNIDHDDLALFEFMIVNKSWWDTVDFIATHLVGTYFKQYPDLRLDKINEWLQSGNIWLQRSALIYQLKWKNQIDTQILAHCIDTLTPTKEFFINKAIGWILREYSKTNPDWVVMFVETHELHSLSQREALRLMKKH